MARFKEADPDLYEMEDVLLNYGKKGDVVDEQVEILKNLNRQRKRRRRTNFGRRRRFV